ncbi:TPA: DivIVA domain-containing protein [Streptococcus suis]
MASTDNLKMSLFGYNKQAVAATLAQKDGEIQALKDQVAAIQVQLDQYIEMEQALKDGIVDARMTGNKIVTESTEEADRIIKRTNEQVTQFKEDFSAHSHDLMDTGLEVRTYMKQMKDDILAILADYQARLEATDFDSLYPEDQVKRFNDQLFDYDHLEIGKSQPSRKKIWDVTSITEEEKQKLELLIHEVIANEKQEVKNQSETKLIQFAKG